MTYSKQEKLNRIYEVIANKELSFGCNVFIQNYITSITICWDNTWKCEVEWTEYTEFLWQAGSYTQPFGLRHIKSIIGHPVMIGDVLDWLDSQGWQKIDWRHPAQRSLLILWKSKRLPIDEQSDETISYIFNLYF